MSAPGWSYGLALLAASCLGTPKAPERVADAELSLEAAGGGRYDVARELGQNRLTVFVFYSESCPCLEAHEARLADIHREYESRGVRLVLVASEVGADRARAELAVRKRGYPFPLLIDRDARVARALEARFATHAVVVDSDGKIRYSGGIDSDKIHLRESATPYLRHAIDDLLAGREPRDSGRGALGCALQLR